VLGERHSGQANLDWRSGGENQSSADLHVACCEIFSSQLAED